MNGGPAIAWTILFRSLSRVRLRNDCQHTIACDRITCHRFDLAELTIRSWVRQSLCGEIRGFGSLASTFARLAQQCSRAKFSWTGAAFADDLTPGNKFQQRTGMRFELRRVGRDALILERPAVPWRG
jgi:hypothetical protein